MSYSARPASSIAACNHGVTNLRLPGRVSRLKVDFDMTPLVIASSLYRLIARAMRGYDQPQARQIFRDIVDMPEREGGREPVGEPKGRIDFRRSGAGRSPLDQEERKRAASPHVEKREHGCIEKHGTREM